MTFDAYTAKMDDYRERITSEDDPLYKEMVEFQYGYMKGLLAGMKDYDPISQKIREIFNYLIEYSQTGSVVVSTDTMEEADAVRQRLYALYGDYLLDYPEVYRDSVASDWCVDCMFGGYYTPAWDGFFE